jgi:hypothetical protein
MPGPPPSGSIKNDTMMMKIAIKQTSTAKDRYVSVCGLCVARIRFETSTEPVEERLR